MFFCVLVLALLFTQTNAYLVRLVGGSTNAEGRVEVFRNSQWQTVCDDGWGWEEGNVVCAQLGFQYAVRVAGNALFGEGTGGPWVTVLRCTGTESNIESCPTVPVSICDHSEDAGLTCSATSLQQGSLRLADSRVYKYAGRVEIYVSNSWGTVCDDRWGNNEANTACRQMGFVGAAVADYSISSGLGPIWLDDVTCSGNESRLIDCTHRGLGVEDCNHNEDIGVRCSRTSSLSIEYSCCEPASAVPAGGSSSGVVVGSVVGAVLVFVCCIPICIFIICCCAYGCGRKKRSPRHPRNVNVHPTVTSAPVTNATRMTVAANPGFTAPPQQQPAVNPAQPTFYDPPPPAYPGTQPDYNQQAEYAEQPYPPGYPPPQTAGYPPPQTAGYPPPQTAGYPPPQTSDYPPPQTPGYPPPQTAGYPPPPMAELEPSAPYPPGQSEYPPGQTSGYPPDQYPPGQVPGYPPS